MESANQKSSRLKNGSQRGSIRRKISFQQVRQQFEKNSRVEPDQKSEISRAITPEKNNVNHNNSNWRNQYVKKEINGYLIVKADGTSKSKVNSINRSDQFKTDPSKSGSNSPKPPVLHKPKNAIKNAIKSSPTANDSIQEETTEDLSKVKSKISFFEQTISKTPEPNDSKKDKPRTDPPNNYETNYGNQDMKVSLNTLDYSTRKAMEQRNSIIVDSVEPNSNIDSDYCLRQKLNAIPNSERNSSISLTSLSSLSSNVMSSNESELDVVLRKHVNNDSNVLVKPVPRQRTSLNRNNIEGFNSLQNDDEVRQLCQRDIRPNSSKTLQTSAKIKRSSSRMSQDSGIDVVNSSYLWQNSTVSHREEDQTKSEHLEEKQDANDEHIYEELVNCRSPNSFCDNDEEWIDIGNEPKKFQIEVVIKKHHAVRPNIYRKSLKSKPHQRKSKARFTTIKTPISDNSETEYEDIDDDESIYSDGICSDNQISSPQEIVPKIEVDQHLSHIYEDPSDIGDSQTIAQHKKDVANSPLQVAFKKELIGRIIKRQNSLGQIEDWTRKAVLRKSISSLDSERENDYSSTPHQIPKFNSQNKAMSENNSIDVVRKRDSQFSRASSIYIIPDNLQINSTNSINRSFDSVDNQRFLIPFSNVRAEIIHKQNSITGSVASYLEFNGPQEDGSPFTDEPLYQFYQKDVRRRAELWIHAGPNVSDSAYDIYENNSIYNNDQKNYVCRLTASSQSKRSSNSVNNCQHVLCKNHISAFDLAGIGPSRSLWCQLPQVINSKSDLLQTLSEEDKRLQEAMFEIITSEASYCKSLCILVTHFNNCIELSEDNPQVVTHREKKSLFSNITDIYKVSSKLLSDLEKRFQQNILLYDICDILYDYAVNHFTPYIHYCAYQRDQEKILLELKKSRTAFVEILQRLESNQICQNQNLLSFLMLPMQRITRYPLLVDAVCQQLPKDSPVIESSRKALAVLNQLVRRCNEEAKKVQRMQELIETEKILQFRNNIKRFPIVSGARYLVKKGSVTGLSAQISPKKTITKSTIKWTKSPTHLFLFSDLLILAKKKSENCYSVFDYCPRNTVQLISLNNIEGSIGCNLQIPIPQNYTNLAQLILLHNHQGKSVEHTISFSLESEKLRWIEAVSQPISDNPNEVIYEEWDCPQVQCIRSYSAKQTDELSLEETDVVNVSRKMKDGWFQGERIRDGARGWFLSDYTEEIVNSHVRARNMRLRHRLLMLTESVIEEQKRMSLSSVKHF